MSSKTAAPKSKATPTTPRTAAPKKSHTGTGKTARPPRSTEDRLKRLFVSLTAQIEGSHLKNAIKTCNKILLLAPGDEDVLQTKLFLLLQTEDYATALELAKSPEHDFQKAYTLYRLNRESDALKVAGEHAATGIDDDAKRGVEHLEAQVHYRAGEYERAVQTYTHLLDTCAPQSEEQSDLLTNMTAAQSHLDFLTSGFQSALASLPASVVQSLETASAPSAPAHHVAAVASASTTAPAAPPTKKGPRPGRVPKGVTPGVTPPPDPERWIKKSERTNVPAAYSRKKGKKAVGAAGTTQGAAVVEQPSGGGGGGGGGKKKKR